MLIPVRAAKACLASSASHSRAAPTALALRMSGDADSGDAGFQQDPRLENIQCAGKFADRPLRVAGDQQNIQNAPGAQFRQCGAQGVGIRDAAHGDVRRREKPGAAHRECGVDYLIETGVRRMRDEDGRALREQGLELGQAAFLGGRNFGGSATHERDDSTFQVVRRRSRAARLTDLDHRCSARDSVVPI